MQTRILHCLDGARRARGLSVVIDVLRATSFQCWAFGRGVSQIIAVASLEEAYALKRADPERLLAGERGLKKPEGFDFGNSPAEIEGLDLSGRTLVHTTSHGTQGLAVLPADAELITGSFLNAGAVARHIAASRAAEVSLVCMGNDGGREAEEDTACAEYLVQCIAGGQPEFGAIEGALRKSTNGAKFLSDRFDYAPARDFELCMMLDCFDFVVGGRRDQAGRAILTKAAA